MKNLFRVVALVLTREEEGDYNPIPITIDRDGFEVVYYGKAAEFYYWRDGRFVQWITSD